jgi:hypothetical protein
VFDGQRHEVNRHRAQKEQRRLRGRRLHSGSRPSTADKCADITDAATVSLRAKLDFPNLCIASKRTLGFIEQESGYLVRHNGVIGQEIKVLISSRGEAFFIESAPYGQHCLMAAHSPNGRKKSGCERSEQFDVSVKNLRI